MRVNRVHWLDTLGPTYARAMSEALYANETYVLGIDSHTNFAEGWDDMLVDMFERIGNDRAIITAYPAGYTAGADQARADLQMMMRADHITSHHTTSHCIALHCIASLQARADVQTAPSKVTTICRTRRVQVGRSRGWSCARAREGVRVCLCVQRQPRSSARSPRSIATYEPTQTERAVPARSAGRSRSSMTRTCDGAVVACCHGHTWQVGRSVSFKHDMNSVPRPRDGDAPVRVAFLAAGFNFARGQ